MASLLYLPRLFVYHCEADKGSKQAETSLTIKKADRLAERIRHHQNIGKQDGGMPKGCA